jgi:excisionase family DNA binding protein
MQPESENFTVYQAARELGCTSQWVRVLLAEGRLPGAEKVDREWRIPASALVPLKQRRETVSA